MEEASTPGSGWDPESATRLLEGFEADLVRVESKSSEILFQVSIRLFRQSVRAYVAKAVDLAAMGCRATVENAGYALLTHRRTSAGGWALIPPGEPGRSSLYTLEEWQRMIAYSWIIRQLRDRRILSDELVAAAFVIKDHGDAAAHFGAQSDRSRFREMGQGRTTPWISQPVSADEAGVLADLKATSRILLELFRWDAAEGNRFAVG
jgi:hypothetical protein